MTEDPNSQRGPSDEQLRELFSILRSEDDVQAPLFIAEPSAQPQYPRQRPGWRVAGVSALAATVLASSLWLRHDPPRGRAAHSRGSDASAVSITEWRPPTDFLLNTPGREILRTAPVIRLETYPHSTGSTTNRAPKTRQATTLLSQ
jgi:hypothetical protein